MAGSGGNQGFVLTREVLKDKLHRMMRGELSPTDLTGWADSIEFDERVSYEPGFESLIAQVLFEISAPEINRSLNEKVCADLISMLAIGNET